MGYEKTLVVLANSRKSGGRCIAGKEIDRGSSRKWIRPVSQHGTGELGSADRVCKDGKEVGVLDVVRLTVIEHDPKDYQRENWLIDREKPITRVGRATRQQLERLVDSPQYLWLVGSSTAHGKDDRIPERESRYLKESLYLIHVNVVGIHWDWDGNKKVDASFEYRGRLYRFRVTDPWVEHAVYRLKAGDYQYKDAFLTLSLAVPFRGYSYKLVAAVISQQRAGE